MEIRFMRQEAIDYIKANIRSYAKYYKQNEFSWLEKEFTGDPFVLYSDRNVEIKLDPYGSEIKNAKKLHEELFFLSDSEATDERLWAGLSHDSFSNFMYQNLTYSIKKDQRIKFNYRTILNRYFLNMDATGRKRSLYINNLSKLWWVARLCYNKASEKPYKYLDLFETAFSHKLINTFSSSFMANKKIRFAVFDTALWLKNDMGVGIKGDTMTPLIKYLNNLGGKLILDALEDSMLKARLYNYVEKNIDYIKSY